MRAADLFTSLLVLAFTGCGTNTNFRSADFGGDKVYKKGAIKPQLQENEVLGIDAKKVSDEEIGRILDQTRTVRVRTGSTILLVQSGASHPDEAMSHELSKRFHVIPNTGVPSELEEGGAVSKALRLAAAHSNAESILVYWGTLEIKRNDLPTSIVSWVPVVDFTVPDEHQVARMYLKVALIDVRTGNWATFRTEAIEEEALTTRFSRERELKGSLEHTKKRLYEIAIQKLADSYLAAAH